MTIFPTDLEAALTAHASQQAISRDDALERIVREWMRTHGFLGDAGAAAGRTQTAEPKSPNPAKPDPEFVQYPGYFKGDGSL
jgi:hypothetical protein